MQKIQSKSAVQDACKIWEENEKRAVSTADSFLRVLLICPEIWHFSNFRAISVPDFQNPNHQAAVDAESDPHLHRPNARLENLAL